MVAGVAEAAGTAGSCGFCGSGACSCPVDSDAATSPEGSVVGALTGSGAVSSGVETEASEVAFPVISELVCVGGRGQAGVFKGQQ